MNVYTCIYTNIYFNSTFKLNKTQFDRLNAARASHRTDPICFRPSVSTDQTRRVCAQSIELIDWNATY